MKTDSTDSILSEVHTVKDALSAEFGHDVSALCRHLRHLGEPARPITRSAGVLNKRRKSSVTRRVGKPRKIVG